MIKKGNSKWACFSYIVVSDDTYTEGKVVFTGLPVICLDGPDDGENRLSQFSIFGLMRIRNAMKHFSQYQCIIKEVRGQSYLTREIIK